MSRDVVNGQPCWMDVSVADGQTREGLMDFLGGLFGWTFVVGGPETGHYTMGLLDGQHVCAIGEQPQGAGQWVTYLNVDDIEESVRLVLEAGGQVFMGPMAVMGAGSMALGMDPVGAVFGMWQKDAFGGFEAFGRPDAPCWFDHQSASPSDAAAFYTSAFGLSFSPTTDDGQGMLNAGEFSCASLSRSPGEMPPYWNPVVGVASVVDAEARALELGATVLMSGMTVPGGIASAFAAPGTGTVITVFESPELPGA
jgi:predicted enzyme related to lactoylglutathione lyase